MPRRVLTGIFRFSAPFVVSLADRLIARVLGKLKGNMLKMSDNKVYYKLKPRALQMTSAMPYKRCEANHGRKKNAD